MFRTDLRSFRVRELSENFSLLFLGFRGHSGSELNYANFIIYTVGVESKGGNSTLPELGVPMRAALIRFTSLIYLARGELNSDIGRLFRPYRLEA